MFSKCVLKLLGLKINVYGLDECKKLPENTPLSVMFFCHGSYKTQEDLEEYCQKMCKLNEIQRSNNRYLIVVSIDHPNVGTRQAYEEEPIPKPGLLTHQDLVLKMYLYPRSTARTIASIIECFDFYAFGTNSKRVIENWGVIGHSMGGITARLLPTFEPKVSTVIIISSSLRSDTWLPHYIKALGFDLDFYAPKMFENIMAAGTNDSLHNLREVHMLLLNGEKDRLIPKTHIDDTIEEFRKIHTGVEGKDWKCEILPETKHALCDAYIIEAMKWTEKWMISKSPAKETKLTANL